MNLLIIEDEMPAVKRLTQLILDLAPQANFLAHLDSVKQSIKWLSDNEPPDLIFMDIQLADGPSFDIFDHVTVASPIIFTTAYNQFMKKAFKVHSIDYLLKPIDPDELKSALEKFERFYGTSKYQDLNLIRSFLNSHKTNKERFLVKAGQQLLYVLTQEIRYFYSDGGILYLKTVNNRKHTLDYTLEQVESNLPQKDFFRINRKIIVHISAIRKISSYFNSRLKLELEPNSEFEVIVSRDRVNSFKEWLDS